MRGHKARFGAVVVMTAMFVALLAGPAWAPRTWGLTNLLADCSNPTDAGEFNGVLSIAQFFDDGGKLAAEITIAGGCNLDDPVFFNGEDVRTSVEILSADCGEAILGFGDVVIRDVSIELSDFPIHVINFEEEGAMRGALCSLAGMGDDAPTSLLVRTLNRALG